MRYIFDENIFEPEFLGTLELWNFSFFDDLSDF